MNPHTSWWVALALPLSFVACVDDSSNGGRLGLRPGSDVVDGRQLPPADRDAAGEHEAAAPANAPVGTDAAVAPDAADDAVVADAGQDAGPARLVLDNVVVDFGDVDCGGEPAAKQLSVTNAGGAALHYSAVVAGPFTIDGSNEGDVAVGATATLSLKAQAVPTSATAGIAIEGSLTVTTNDPTLPTATVPLRITPQGGVITVAPATAGFGEVLAGTNATDIDLVVTNSGTRPVTVAFGTPSNAAFAIGWSGAPSAVSLAAGASLTGAKAQFHPSAVGSASGTAAIVTTGATCGGSATSLALEGTGTSVPVTVGPSPLDFGLVDCGQTAPAKDVTLDNPNGFAVSFNAALALGGASPHSISPSSGVIPAKGKATIKVTPKAINAPASTAAGAFNDSINITTDAPDDAGHVVSIVESARGAVLALTMAQALFGSVDVGTTKSLPLSVSNNGNASASVTLTATGAGFGLSPAGAHTIAVGGSQPYTGTFAPAATGPVTGSIAVAFGAGPVCSATLQPTVVTGTGLAAIATLSNASAALDATCGSGAPSTTLTIKNTGNKTLTMSSWTLPAPFTLAGAPSSLAPNAQATVTIGAPAAVVGTDPGGKIENATLSFQTNEVGAPTRTLPVAKTTVGANLEYRQWGMAISEVEFDDNCGFVPPADLTVLNTGNASVTINPNAVPAGAVMSWTAAANQVTPGGSAASITCTYQGGPTSPVSPALVTGPVCMPLAPLGAFLWPACLPP